MEKRTLYALLAVVALGAIAFAVMRSPEKGQRSGPAPRPVAVVKAADLVGLEITDDKNQKTVLSRQSGQWRITAPGDWKADQQGVKQVLDGLEKLTFADVASENVDKQAELGVADGKGARVTAKNAKGDAVVDLHIGKAVGGYTMVRADGKSETWQASGLFPYTVNRAPSGWRDHAIFEVAAADVTKLTAEGGGGKLVLEKEASADKDKPNDTKWKIVETTGTAPKTSADLDMAQVNAVVQGLSNLHASDFADDKKVDETKGKLTLTLTTKDNKAHTLFVGPEKGDDVLVATSDGPQVYTVKKFSIEHIAKKPIDYRDKTIVKAKEADLASVEITAGGETTTLTQGKDGKWTAAKGTAPLDDSKVKPALGGFDNFTAASFAEEKEPAKTGLAKPAGRAVLKFKGGKPAVTIAVGNSTKDGDYYVQKVGSPDVYLVKKYAVDRWMKKTADLTKKK